MHLKLTESPLPQPSRLDDPLYASIAWARYWRLMRAMAVFTLICITVAFAILFYLHGWLSIHMYIATAGGVALTLMLMAALMGLVFLSSESGHDESIDDPVSKDISPDE
ncbi:hypothetical protein [Sphingorhabdus sp. M41]|uniref:hypothetical protein n=1 Tax=Sphingorhabdus sp. M41 TaxID=1806885 RepID=UPI000B00DB8B|nr:hypothetical protein [Sphingorhabdus sp. M41]